MFERAPVSLGCIEAIEPVFVEISTNYIEAVSLTLDFDSNLSIHVDVLEPMIGGRLSISSDDQVVISSLTGRKWSRSEGEWSSELETIQAQSIKDQVKVDLKTTVESKVTLVVTLTAANSRPAHQSITIQLMPKRKVCENF